MKKIILISLFFMPVFFCLSSCSDNPENTLNPVQMDYPIYELYQNYPNPFNGITKIRFAISQTGFVNMKITNSSGKGITVLLNQNLTAGVYEISFNGYDFPGGIYIYTLTVTTGSATYSFKKQMELIK